MRIPVFVSCPTDLRSDQNKIRRLIFDLLNELRLEPRALGRSDYPKDVPLKEVYIIAKHCHGGVILGFEQFQAKYGIWKRGTKKQKILQSKEKPVIFPSPWNQLEAGILFGLRLPLLIFRESEELYGGIFDVGTSEVFVHKMPPAIPKTSKKKELMEIFLKWHAEVSRHYHEF
jgi:hypothetical protein